MTSTMVVVVVLVAALVIGMLVGCYSAVACVNDAYKALPEEDRELIAGIRDRAQARGQWPS